MKSPAFAPSRYTKPAPLLVAGALVILTACTHGRDWDTYQVTLVTDPPGASCTTERYGIVDEAPDPTPVRITLTTGNAPITITCALAGYAPVSGRNSSIFQSTDLPPLNWSTVYFSERRIKDGNEATQTRRDSLQATAS